MRYFIVIGLISILSCKNSPSLTSVDGEIENTLSQNVGRSSWQKPQLVIDKLGDLSDKVVADIGAGSGFFSFRIAFKAKKVIAMDIDPQMIGLIELQKGNLPQELTSKIQTRLVSAQDPRLTKGEADIIIMINTASYITDLKQYFTTLSDECLKGNKLLIVDFKDTKNELILGDNPKLDPQEVKSFLELSGFKTIEVDERTLEYQFIILAEKIDD
jgi:2-polyprenyl-3-methyl-5-hydroxy-6-metoxy-1,4-benzoquinol methylase